MELHHSAALKKQSSNVAKVILFVLNPLTVTLKLSSRIKSFSGISRTCERNNQKVCEGGKEPHSFGGSQYLGEVSPGIPKSQGLVDGFCS
ncbi:MAG: hypothetical protein NTY64_09695 [Deltaproteobacteria bacterium]|nr:hypothetical protein [Deltaproteobacteria bacterium]